MVGVLGEGPILSYRVLWSHSLYHRPNAVCLVLASLARLAGLSSLYSDGCGIDMLYLVQIPKLSSDIAKVICQEGASVEKMPP